MRKLPVILGPTSTGKTDLAINLAKKFKGELISCDSRQVYVGLDIGTGKMPGKEVSRIKKGKGFWEINGVRIWMYDVVNPKYQYSVARYIKDANRVIWDIRERGKLPIVVGGTGLYLKALIEGLSNLTIPPDKALRKQLEKISLKKLQEKLQNLSLKKWQSMNYSDHQNPRRLIRAIEIVTLRESPVDSRDEAKDFPRMWDSNQLRDSSQSAQNDILKIGLTAPREILYQRIDARVVSRLKAGMVDEAKRLHKNGLTFRRMKQLGLEYGILADFLKGQINFDEAVKILQGEIHGFLRRQITWFKKEKDIVWFDITEKNYPILVEKLVAKWYYNE